MTEWTAGDWVIDADMKDEPEYVWLTNANKAPLFKIEPITGTTEEITDGLNLIGAAPDLYGALEAICDELLNGGTEQGATLIAKHGGTSALAKAKQS